MSLRVKFTLLISAVLTLVMLGAGAMLSSWGSEMAQSGAELRIARALELTVNEGAPENLEQIGSAAKLVPGTNVKRFPVHVGVVDGVKKEALAYQAHNEETNETLQLLVPAQHEDQSGKGLDQLILVVTLVVIGVGALASLFIANGVAKPIEILVDDVRQIARGNLIHKTRVRGGGELRALSREIDKMAASLKEGQATELELSAREREMEVAAEVRDSLIPAGMPSVPGYDLEALQNGCPTPGGDFFDVLEYEDGRIGMLICEVNGEGVPGALVGAASRAYLSSLLLPSVEVGQGMKDVNRYLSKGLRRGMCISVIYAVLEPKSGNVEVLCAGHKVPVLHYKADDSSVHKMQPEGLALGLDKGPVFDRRLEKLSFKMAPGDRILLANSGPILVQNPAGQEYGEERFYRLAMKRAAECSEEVLGVLEGALDAYADPEDFPHDISIITIRRDA